MAWQMASSFDVVEKVLTAADTEYYVDLPVNTAFFTLQCRTSTVIKVSASERGAAAVAPYWTVKEETVWTSPPLRQGVRLWLQAPVPGVTVEIVVWH